MTKAHEAFLRRRAKRDTVALVYMAEQIKAKAMSREICKLTIKYLRAHPLPFPAPSFEVPSFNDSLRLKPSTPKEAFMQDELLPIPEPSFNTELAEYDFEPSLDLDAETEPYDRDRCKELQEEIAQEGGVPWDTYFLNCGSDDGDPELPMGRGDNSLWQTYDTPNPPLATELPMGSMPSVFTPAPMGNIADMSLSTRYPGRLRTPTVCHGFKF